MTDHQYPEQSQATTALVLGILGVVLCGLLGPFAWRIGGKEVKAIDAGRRAPENRSQAQAGRIMGIVETAFLALAIPTAIVAIVAVVVAGADRNEEGDIVESGTLSVFDLEIGDCGDWPDADVYRSVTVHPCANAHDFEVYALRDFPDDSEAVYPGETAAEGWADQECLNAFEGYVGITWEESPDLTYTYLYPTEDSWAEGDREILCALAHINEGTPLVGSKQGSGNTGA
jgi:hypothetical protein